MFVFDFRFGRPKYVLSSEIRLSNYNNLLVKNDSLIFAHSFIQCWTIIKIV